MANELVWIRSYADAAEGRAAQAALDAHGIHSIIADENAGAGPELRYQSGTRLGVRDDEAAAARTILADGGAG